MSPVASGQFHEYIPVTGNIVPRTTAYLDAVEGSQVTHVRRKRCDGHGRRNPEGIEVLEGLRAGDEVTSSYESLLAFNRVEFRVFDRGVATTWITS